MSRSYRHDSKYRGPTRPHWSPDPGKDFRCKHCKLLVGPIPYGGAQRNHCPFCLYSRHVDGRTPGDRASECGGSMAPIGLFARGKGEQVVLHRCLACGFERHNRVAADDSYVVLLRLPLIAPRTSARGQPHHAEDELMA